MKNRIPSQSTTYGPTLEWVVAARYGTPEAYGIPTAPCLGEDEGDEEMDLTIDGETVLKAKRPVKIRR